MKTRPVVIVGAPRSGTNILRDVLTRHPGLVTWDCDEINYVWRYGNRRHPTDEFRREFAHRRARDYIRSRFGRLERPGVTHIVEKTCANSLRVGFVDAVLPEARYIFIVRDGRDVIASAMKRWQADFDPKYILRKARYVPMPDVPYYATRFIHDRLFRRLSGEKRARSWGPRFDGMFEVQAREGLPGVCAAQWAACVSRSLDAFAEVPAERVFRLRYEGFVASPAESMAAIGEFLEISATPAAWRPYTRDVFTSNVGKGCSELPDETFARVRHHLDGVLARLGYTESPG